MFETTKMKKTTVCATWRRSSLVASRGRMRRTEAPVVPTRDARTAPTARKAVFTAGRAWMSPVTSTPPETTNRLASRAMNER
jgi:hypothetical protein